jgi:predicted extracellular nuclease
MIFGHPQRIFVLGLALTACAEGAQGAGTQGVGGGATGSGGAGATGIGGATGAGGDTSATTSSGSASSGSGGGGEGGGGAAGGASASTGSSSSSGSGGAPAGTLFFSEYVEGSGNDKAVEIVNLGSTPFALGDCVVEGYQNGASSPTATISLSGGNLASGAVHVLCNNGFSESGACDQLDGNLQHSGDDALALKCGGTTKDVFGRIGEQEVWGQDPTSSQDVVLRRSCDVVAGDSNGNDGFDPGDEWEGFPQDAFGELGSYGCP